MKYDLKGMVDKPAGVRILIPAIGYPIAFEKSYLALLRKVLAGAAEGIRDIIAPSFLIQEAQRVTTDADESTFTAFRALLGRLVRSIVPQFRDLLKLEGRRHTKSWMQAAKKAIGVDLRGAVKDEDLDDFLEAVALRNAALIQGMAEDLIKSVQYETIQAVLNGESYSQLQKKLKERLGVSDSRARLIARDQSSKLKAALDKKRAEDAGLNEYIFRTSEDERVRPTHEAMANRTCRYDDPTVYQKDGKWVSRSGVGGVKLHPGEDIQCRCSGQAVIVWEAVEIE